MKPERMKYHGITYVRLSKKERKWWRKKMCKRGVHCFDEVLSSAGGKPEDGGWHHYLNCDCCNLIVEIAGIDKTYVKKSKGK